jgi:hypothetical protein
VTVVVFFENDIEALLSNQITNIPVPNVIKVWPDGRSRKNVPDLLSSRQEFRIITMFPALSMDLLSSLQQSLPSVYSCHSFGMSQSNASELECVVKLKDLFLFSKLIHVSSSPPLVLDVQFSFDCSSTIFSIFL